MTRLCAGVLAVGVGSAWAVGAEINLTKAHSSAKVGVAIFETTDFRPAGAGATNPFVQIQNKDVEEGYNTSAHPMPLFANQAASFARDLQVRDLGVQTVNGVRVYEFVLNIDQSSTKPLLSLDRLKVFVSPTGGHSSMNLNTLGAVLFDLDAKGDNWIKLNSSLNAGGATQGDMRFFLPVDLFKKHAPTDYVTLYSKFGTHNGANSGYEEWSFVAGTALPTPGGALLLGLAAGMTSRRRR